MRAFKIEKRSVKFIKKLDPKQSKQIFSKILDLLSDPTPNDCRPLKGYEAINRVDIGEYRIVYRFDDVIIEIILIDKRNDDTVYKKLGRLKI